MKHWLLLFLAILSEVIATSALRASEGFTRLWPSVLVVSGYGAAFYLLSLTLQALPLGVAYAVWSGVGLALITVVGWVVYGQKLDTAAIIGMVLILAGVIVINAFSRTTTV